MANLKTTFAGLKLKNPVIISSSGLTNTPDKIKQLENAGAAAVVLKSVFEEQIHAQTGTLHGYGSPEADDYLNTYVRSHMLDAHISLLKETKKHCTIPVIASINCYSDQEWTNFAVLMEQAGADALEINILALQTEKNYIPGSFEQRHLNILRRVKKEVKIPVIMKLGNNFTNPVTLIDQLYANGADAVVLFNRLYQPDIDIDRLTIGSTDVMSQPGELASRLRWTAIASAAVPQLDYAISGGVHNGKCLAKSILAGAAAAEVCTAVYRHGTPVIATMLDELSQWMDNKGFDTLAQYKGKLNAQVAGDINPFERTQFMKYYSEHHE